MPPRYQIFNSSYFLDPTLLSYHERFLSSPIVREYLYSTASSIEDLLEDLDLYPMSSSFSLLHLLEISKYSLYQLPNVYHEGISKSLLRKDYPREIRFWILSRGNLPPFLSSLSEEEKQIIYTYPYLFPAWKHFPEQVNRWIFDREYRLRMWPYEEDEIPLPEELAYDTLHPEAEAFEDVPLIFDWSEEFPFRQAWLEANRNYESIARQQEFDSNCF